LYNRAFFEEEMTRSDAAAIPLKHSYGDLNNLKGTNDRDGHASAMRCSSERRRCSMLLFAPTTSLRASAATVCRPPARHQRRIGTTMLHRFRRALDKHTPRTRLALEYWRSASARRSHATH